MRGKALILLVIAALAGFPLQAQADDITLGTAGNFAALGGSTVTNTGSTILYGDLGLYPGPSITGFRIPPANTVVEGEGSTGLIAGDGLVTGTIYIRGGVAQQAHDDASVAYTAAKNAPGAIAGPGDLGGATLDPGVYTYGAGEAPWAADDDRTLTLDAKGKPDAQWIFQIGSTLITPANAMVVFADNVGSPYNVFWQVGSSATLGANNTFAGNILAQTSIDFPTGGTLYGRALALDGAVTIGAAETITAPEPGTCLLLISGLVSLFASRRRRNSVA
jgi:hypothetical protein